MSQRLQNILNKSEQKRKQDDERRSSQASSVFDEESKQVNPYQEVGNEKMKQDLQEMELQYDNTTAPNSSVK